MLIVIGLESHQCRTIILFGSVLIKPVCIENQNLRVQWLDSSVGRRYESTRHTLAMLSSSKGLLLAELDRASWKGGMCMLD